MARKNKESKRTNRTGTMNNVIKEDKCLSCGRTVKVFGDLGKQLCIPCDESHPDLLTYWRPELDFGIEYNVNVFDPNRKCEVCKTQGAYVLRDDWNSGACCRLCLNADTKTILKIEELPGGHDY